MPTAAAPPALIHDWNAPERSAGGTPRPPALLDDTLRDGLQNAGVRQPALEERAELLHHMAAIGIGCVNLGLPGSSALAFSACERLAREIVGQKLPLVVACAGRTLEADMNAIVELCSRSGLALEGHAFVGASAIRAHVEGWDLDLLKRRTEAALGVLVRAGIPAVFVTEDTTRTDPDTLRALFRVALSSGATRLCLCDTVGHATPAGARRLVTFTRAFAAECGSAPAIDWHGHNDRGLALANALEALAAGADRAHATALGLGERVGNVPMELLVLNLALAGKLPLGSGELDLVPLAAYCRRSAELLGWQIPPNHPLVGENAFRTATGVHAAAILKAKKKGAWAADRVYGAVPAGALGREQEICVGAMSGGANVAAWLDAHGIAPDEELVRRVLEHARSADHILSDAEIRALLPALPGGRPA
ncbi:MAG TPA: 2-isopropylmalate synthase [Polyangiaceae bacterium]